MGLWWCVEDSDEGGKMMSCRIYTINALYESTKTRSARLDQTETKSRVLIYTAL